MTFSTEWRDNFRGYEQTYDQGVSGTALPQKMAAAALLCVAFACAWTLWTNLTAPAPDQGQEAVEPAPKPAPAWSAEARRSAVAIGYAKLAKALHGVAKTASKEYDRLFDARYSLGFPPGTFSRTAALEANDPSAEPASGQTIIRKTPAVTATGSVNDQVAPAPRVPPARIASLRAAPHVNRAADTPAEKPTIFERLFGKPASLTLAYAAPDDGDLGGTSLAPGRYDRYTAVYDISAHVVYMPDGTTLEAHSGYGNRLDDPRHTDERMRGATPPAVYDLKPRESLFHGVQALRLIPEDEDKVFGRSGLLAHTYMLGPNGDSNGCVSFRDYNAFLQAYMSHKIKRLAVVTRLE